LHHAIPNCRNRKDADFVPVFRYFLPSGWERHICALLEFIRYLFEEKSAVERELLLRLASVLWRLRRATTMETGLLEIQADHHLDLRQDRQPQPKPQQITPAGSGWAYSVDDDTGQLGIASGIQTRPSSGQKARDSTTDLATCFLRLANLPSFPLDRLSQYEATLWRQASQILFALGALDRRKPQERGQRFSIGSCRNYSGAVP
jgi:hypothetical protein